MSLQSETEQCLPRSGNSGVPMIQTEQLLKPKRRNETLPEKKMRNGFRKKK